MTQEQALALFNSKFWEEMDLRQRATFQLHEPRLCMPFGVFHEAVEKTLGRSVWTHEFAYPEQLRQELYGERPAPSMEEIIGLIPADKRVILLTP